MNTSTCVALAATLLVASSYAETYTSSSYAQSDHMVAQWDGIDNAGVGVHDPDATVWKDLKGSLDMTLTAKGCWTSSGKALYVSGMGAQGTSATPAYKTIEIVYRMTDSGGRILFCSGMQSRFAVFDGTSVKKIYFDGSQTTKRVGWTWDADAVVSIAATHTDTSVSDVFLNGKSSCADTGKNTWAIGDGKVAVGGRMATESSAIWTGEIYAIRLYDTVLTEAELAANRKIDEERFVNETKGSEQYVQDGLIAQWDGIDNEGSGTNNPNATVWKDLKGSLNLTLTNNACWNSNGNGLVVDGISAFGTAATPVYKTIEIVFNRTNASGRILFNSGLKSRFVVFDAWSDNTEHIYFSGSADGTICQWKTRNINAMSFFAARYDNAHHVTDISSDGTAIDAVAKTNTWGASSTVVLGGRLENANAYPWYGQVHAIRLYNRRLTRAEIAHNNIIDRKRFLSLDSYRGSESIQNMWDGECNFAKGVSHNPKSAIWKDLRGSSDLTLTTNGSWTASGNGLAVNGASATAKAAATGYQTIEIAYRRSEKTKNAASIMFDSGSSSTRQMVAWYNYGLFAIFSGKSADHLKVSFSDDKAVHVIAATYTNMTTTAEFAYGDGVRTTGTQKDSWSVRNTFITIGDNASEFRPWRGEIYAIRLYDRELTATEIAFNSALDKKRIAFAPKTVTWAGENGNFETSANWEGGVLPRYVDAAVIATGTVTSREDQIVGSLSLGADAALAIAVTDSAVPLTVRGALAADEGAGIVLDANAFGKAHPNESVTLIECGADSSAALATLAKDLSFVNTGAYRRGTLSVVGGRKLVYTAPRMPGLTLICR